MFLSRIMATMGRLEDAHTYVSVCTHTVRHGPCAPARAGKVHLQRERQDISEHDGSAELTDAKSNL
jgi:hypothetical protein